MYLAVLTNYTGREMSSPAPDDLAPRLHSAVLHLLRRLAQGGRGRGPTRAPAVGPSVRPLAPTPARAGGASLLRLRRPRVDRPPRPRRARGRTHDDPARRRARTGRPRRAHA